MSDLDDQIWAWRVSLEQKVGPNSAAELEDHLRTIIDSLAPTGLPDQERLLLASYRVGHPDALAAEFAKNDPFAFWRERLAWMLVGLVPLQLLLTMIGNSLSSFGSWKLFTWGMPPWAGASVGLAVRALLLLAVLITCLWVGKATHLLRWTRIQWIAASFARLASLLVLIVVALSLGPFIVSFISGDRVIDPSRLQEWHELVIFYRVGEQWLYLVFNIVSAVLIAWLVASRGAEPAPEST